MIEQKYPLERERNVPQIKWLETPPQREQWALHAVSSLEKARNTGLIIPQSPAVIASVEWSHWTDELAANPSPQQQEGVYIDVLSPERSCIDVPLESVPHCVQNYESLMALLAGGAEISKSILLDAQQLGLPIDWVEAYGSMYMSGATYTELGAFGHTDDRLRDNPEVRYLVSFGDTTLFAAPGQPVKEVDDYSSAVQFEPSPEAHIVRFLSPLGIHRAPYNNPQGRSRLLHSTSFPFVVS